MSNTRFVVFHAGVETLETYLPLMLMGRAVLKLTNPGARYIVLTDKITAPHFPSDLEIEVLAPPGVPLMPQFVMAQLEYERKAEPGLVVLAGTDCVAQKDLSDSLQHSMAITYRPNHKYPINNVAYIEDHELAAWFLQRALGLMRPRDYQFAGDMNSWTAALGDPLVWEKVDPEDDKEDCIRLAKLEGRSIHLYPCRTHNHFPKFSGALSENSKRAYILHYKGARKTNMVESVSHYIMGRATVPGVPNWRANREKDREAHPLRQRRGD